MCIATTPQHNHMPIGSAAGLDTPPSSTFTLTHHNSLCRSTDLSGHRCSSFILQRVSRVVMLFDFNAPLLPDPHDHTDFDQTSFSTLSTTHGLSDHHHQTAFHRGYHHHRPRHHRSSHRHGRSQGHYRRVENRAEKRVMEDELRMQKDMDRDRARILRDKDRAKEAELQHLCTATAAFAGALRACLQ
ncbi:hypothetical protein FOZ61_005547 [Perkinsus olseni]|uniref:Uncharacterized protein n=1 Tax=Perkinsus olseni TaxID=32597 RepID=A0A7J6LHB3_PEROL|nr:hypothetical protein FOZ61_005547 [Perkinsus olseni]